MCYIISVLTIIIMIIDSGKIAWLTKVINGDETLTKDEHFEYGEYF